jgi:hypothetical protein
VKLSYKNVAIPFVKYGNRQALTSLQLLQDPALMEFYRRFAHLFEHDGRYDLNVYCPEKAQETIPSQAVEGKGSTEGVETRR